jgi:hypothetical protein
MADDSKWSWSRTFSVSFTSPPPPPPPPGECGTGRLVIFYSTEKRRRGKPPLANLLKRDRMVAYVEHHDPHREFRTRTVEAAAELFRCDVQTVYRALREYRPPRVTSLPDVEWGPLTLYRTVHIGPVVPVRIRITSMHTIRFANQKWTIEPQAAVDRQLNYCQ